jgi:hypothetical protein
MTHIHGKPDLMPFEPEDERYHITTDAEADRWVEKIRDARAERDRFVNACNERIAEFEARAKAAEEECDKECGFALALLHEYFGTVERKHSKTQETYSLPSGKLIYKLPSIAPRIDEERLLNWVKAEAPEFVATTVKTKWGELKKALVLKGDHYIFTATGEIVDGLTPEEKEGGFDIK